MNFFRPLAAALAVLPGLAMAEVLPVTEPATPNAFLDGIEGRLRTIYNSATPEFLAELQDRDLADRFSYGQPPQDRTLATADVAVVTTADWQEASDLWRGMGIGSMIASVMPLVGTDAIMSVTEMTKPDGTPLMVISFARDVVSPAIPDKCYARAVIDAVYMGYGNSDYDLMACRDSFQ